MVWRLCISSDILMCKIIYLYFFRQWLTKYNQSQFLLWFFRHYSIWKMGFNRHHWYCRHTQFLANNIEKKAYVMDKKPALTIFVIDDKIHVSNIINSITHRAGYYKFVLFCDMLLKVIVCAMLFTLTDTFGLLLKNVYKRAMCLGEQCCRRQVTINHKKMRRYRG